MDAQDTRRPSPHSALRAVEMPLFSEKHQFEQKTISVMIFMPLTVCISMYGYCTHSTVTVKRMSTLV